MSKALQSYLEEFGDRDWVIGIPHEVLEPVAKAYYESQWDKFIADTKRLADSK